MATTSTDDASAVIHDQQQNQQQTLQAAPSSSFGPNIHVSSHPVLFHKISVLRSVTTPPGTFRSVLREVTYHLGYEATKELETKRVPLTVSVGKEAADEHVDCMGYKIKDRVSLVTILRSGLGMSDAMLELLPKAAVHHVGMYRMPGHAPVQYFNRLPKRCDCDVAFVLDPVIGSSATVMAVVAILKKWGVAKIHIVCVLASHHGLTTIQEAHPDIYVTVGMVDEGLTHDGIILPGLGDSGDRLFGTTVLTAEAELDDDQALLHVSKRKRTASSDSMLELGRLNGMTE